MATAQFESLANQAQDLPTLESDIETLFYAAIESSSPVQDQKSDVIPGTSDSNMGFVINDILLEELLNGNLTTCEREEEGEEWNQLEIDVEVEDLVAMPPEWGENVWDLVEQLGFLGQRSNEERLD